MVIAETALCLAHNLEAVMNVVADSCNHGLRPRSETTALLPLDWN